MIRNIQIARYSGPDEGQVYGSAQVTSAENVQVRENTWRAGPMTPARFREVLVVLGWSARDVARRVGYASGTMGARWWSGEAPVPAPVAEWLENMARCWGAACRAFPAPRRGRLGRRE